MKPQDRRRRSNRSAKRVGIARFRPEDWPKWIETVDDPEELSESHAEWLRGTTEMAERLSRAGLEVVWIDVEPESFGQWCRERGIGNDSEARSRYAAERIGNLPSPANSD